MKLQQDIIRITAEYFKDEIDYKTLLDASNAYKELLYDICEENLNDDSTRSDIHFENGKALGTYWAALCLDDLMRTRQFIRGTNNAFKDKLAQQENLSVLYAGTGPFATILLPILLRHPQKTVKYTFLEINEISLRLVKKVVAKLELSDYDIEFVQADATTYQLQENKPDIIISETMQNGLFKEQQVSIFYNLMEQAKTETVFIPEDISLFVGLKQGGIPFEKLTREHFTKQEKVLQISKENMVSQKDVKGEPIFPKQEVYLNSDQMQGFNQLVLITHIQVYKNEVIRLNESGLTTPRYIADTPSNAEDDLSIKTQYVISDEPKLDYNIVSIKKQK
jgi:predicted RNA methylase